MKKDEFVKLGISEDLAAKAEAASAEELKGYIPKERFNEVNNEKKELEKTLSERDGQLETLKQSAGSVEDMKKQIAELQAENKSKDEAHAAELAKLKLDNAVDTALAAAGAKNIKAVKALLALEKAEAADDGTVKGLAEQIAALQKSDEYLFETKDNNIRIKGAKPGETGNENGDKTVDISKMNYTELAAYMAEHPDAKID